MESFTPLKVQCNGKSCHKTFSWWEILTALLIELRVHWLVLMLVFIFFFHCLFSLFIFALHGGNKPHYSCETLRKCHPASAVGQRAKSEANTDWCFWIFIKWKNKRFYWLNIHSIFKKAITQLKTVTIYRKNPQISINTVLLFFALYCVCFFNILYFCT